jgi:hypothetical protein
VPTTLHHALRVIIVSTAHERFESVLWHLVGQLSNPSAALGAVFEALSDEPIKATARPEPRADAGRLGNGMVQRAVVKVMASAQASLDRAGGSGRGRRPARPSGVERLDQLLPVYRGAGGRVRLRACGTRSLSTPARLAARVKVVRPIRSAGRLSKTARRVLNAKRFWVLLATLCQKLRKLASAGRPPAISPDHRTTLELRWAQTPSIQCNQ